MGYDPLTTLRGFAAASEIRDAGITRRERLLRLAQDQKQVDQQNQIDAAAKASVTNVPAQTDNLGTFRAGGADLPMGSVGMAPHSEFDSQGFSGRLKAINPLMGQEYDQNQAALQQKQGDAQIERQQKLVTLENGLADLVAKKGAAAKTDLDNVIGAAKYQAQLASMVKGAAPENKEQAFQYARKAVMDHPQLAQFAQQLPEHYTPELEPFLDSIISGSVDVQKVAEKAGESLNPKADQRYRDIQKKLALGQPLTAEEKADAKSYEKQKLLVPATTAQIRVEGMGKIRQFPVYDSQTKQTVYMDSNEINDAKLTAPGRYTVPNFSPEAIQQQGAAKASVSGGTISQIRAFNTADRHLKTLRQAAVALDSGDVKAINAIANKVGAQVGSEPLATYNAINQIVGGDVNRAVSAAGSLAEGEMQTVRKVFDAAAPTKAKLAAIDATLGLIKDKRDVMKEQYDAAATGELDFGSDKPSNTPYPGKQPASQGGGVSVLAPNGKSYKFPNQAAADAFKQKAGIQ